MQLTGSSISKVGDCTPVNERTIGCWLVSRGGRGRNGSTERRASVEGGRRSSLALKDDLDNNPREGGRSTSRH